MKSSSPDANRKFHHTKQKGAFSLELGLVLLVIALLVAGAVTYYRDNIRKTSINDNVAHLTFIGSNIRVKYGSANLYSQITTANAVRARLISANLRDGADSTATNPFGSPIVIAPANLTASNDAARIDWGNTPASQCSDIVTGSQGEFRQIQVAGTSVKPLDGQLDLGTLENQCESAGANGNVMLQFWVGRS